MPFNASLTIAPFAPFDSYFRLSIVGCLFALRRGVHSKRGDIIQCCFVSLLPFYNCPIFRALSLSLNISTRIRTRPLWPEGGAHTGTSPPSGGLGMLHGATVLPTAVRVFVPQPSGRRDPQKVASHRKTRRAPFPLGLGGPPIRPSVTLPTVWLQPRLYFRHLLTTKTAPPKRLAGFWEEWKNS